jgi:DNA-binding NarL/FixJ family response regulator
MRNLFRNSERGEHLIPKAERKRCALTQREREVLVLIAQDNALKQIAMELNISLKTVESHKAAIMKKLNTYSLVGLTRYAIKEGLAL